MHTRGLLIITTTALLALGCDGSGGTDAGPPMSDAGGGGTDAGPPPAVDAGSDAGIGPTPGETAACENLLAIDPAGGCASGGSIEACEDALVDLRTTYAEPEDCRPEYLLWVSCLTTLAACDSGTQCPTEYEAFRTCSGAP